MRYRFHLVTLVVFVLDHWTKWAVASRLGPRDHIEVFPGFFSIAYVSNSGVAFGLFGETQSAWKPYLLAAMAVAAVLFILLYSARMPLERTLLQLALAVTMGGILGNFTDRILRGFVVDFIELHIHDSFHWPTFNVADAAITAGIAMLLVDTIKNPAAAEKEMV